MKRILLVAVLFMAASCSNLFGQDVKPPFWNDIQKFRHTDSIVTYQKNAILFVGSSSFTKWTDIKEFFPGYPIINRGFGGSVLPDVIRYADDIIFPYHPKQIVIYCGENDIASSDTITANTVVNRFIQLFQLIRTRLPKVSVVYVSLKPSPSRWQRKEAMVATNQLIKDFLAKQKKAVFVNVWDDMLDTNGKPIESLFVADKLHMTKEGYLIWQKNLWPHLLKK